MITRHSLGARLAMAAVVGLFAGAPALAAKADSTALAGSAHDFLAHVLAPDNDRGTGAPDLSYDAGFRKLVADNERLFPEEDLMDSDPACQCQTPGMTYGFTGKLVGANRYDAVVHRTGTGPGSADPPWTVVLHRVRGHWAIYDVVNRHGGFRARLVRHNACARVKRARHENPEECPGD
jgi:hypothetical protein